MRNSLHTFDTYKRILDMEELSGRLKMDTFSAEVQQLSAELKEERLKLKRSSKKERAELEQSVIEKKERYESARTDEIRSICERIQRGDFSIELKLVNAKGKVGYTTANVESMLVSKVLMLDLKRSYHCSPANRNEIVEELYTLLDNSMPKIVIRADVHHFFESSPQDRLLNKLMEDSYLPVISLKYLKTFLYKYNVLSGNLNSKTGIPRGLSFSSYLAEIYMSVLDRKVRQIDGVFFYKRYVDDIIILAYPNNQASFSKEGYRQLLSNEIAQLGLTLNDNDKKWSCEFYSSNSPELKLINYLGYQFRSVNGKTDVLLTESKVNRYKDCLRLIFDQYKEKGHYTSRKKTPPENRIDSTIQFMHRLSALTGNGHLNGRKNFVLVGIYYSNKYLTTLEQLEDLDAFMKKCVLSSHFFNPRRTMFQYGTDNSYESCLHAMQEKIITEFSFLDGFSKRRLYRWNDYTKILKQIGNLYYRQNKDESTDWNITF